MFCSAQHSDSSIRRVIWEDGEGDEEEKKRKEGQSQSDQIYVDLVMSLTHKHFGNLTYIAPYLAEYCGMVIPQVSQCMSCWYLFFT
jgi:hypothetical protein